MKAKLFICTVLFILLYATFRSDECSAQQSGPFTYELKGNGNAIITEYDWEQNDGTDIYVPRIIDGYIVTEIGNGAFIDHSLRKFMESHYYIDEKGAYDCRMESDRWSMDKYGTENIYDGICAIGNSAGKKVFVVLPDTITVIGDMAFYQTYITGVTIPSSVQQIGSGAFAHCRNMKNHSVEKGNSVYTTIDGILYNKTTKELVSVPAGFESKDTMIIPEGIRTIGEFAFAGCDIYSDIIFSSTIEEIENFAFEGTRLNGYKIDLNNVEKIGAFAFFGCDYVWGIHANNLNEIGDWAFAHTKVRGFYTGDEEFTEFVWHFPATLRELGEGVFAWSEMEANEIDLSNTSISYIPAYTFMDTTWVGDEWSYELRTSGKYETIKDTINYVWKKNNGAIDDKTYITTIKLPDIDTIGDYAFMQNKGEIKDGVPSRKTPRIIMPSSVKTIGSYAFSYRNIIMYWPEISQLETIGNGAFNGTMLCKEPITYHEYSFYGDGTGIGLDKVTEKLSFPVPEGVNRIGDNAFMTDYINYIVIPASVTNIGESICDRANTTLEVESDSYAEFYAREDGYQYVLQDNDLSWLND